MGLLRGGSPSPDPHCTSAVTQVSLLDITRSMYWNKHSVSFTLPEILEKAYHVAFIPRARPHVAHVPMSLALQDKNHLSVHIEIFLMKYTLSRLKLITRKLISTQSLFFDYNKFIMEKRRRRRAAKQLQQLQEIQ
jgi:hypothetical protein